MWLQSVHTFCAWLQDTGFSTSIRESAWLFPIIETTHVIALAASVGIIVIVDLRLIGLGLIRDPASTVSDQLLPWALGGFVTMFVTGILLFCSMPMKCYDSVFFRIKMVLLIFAGLNALIFQVTIYRSMNTWETATVPPFRARLAGGLSLMLWAAIIAAGRMMAYKF